MKLQNSVEELIGEFSEITKEPTAFLSVQSKLENEAKQLLKKLYDFTKQTEDVLTKNNFTLPNLIVESFDSEQIWQQIQLQNQLIGEELEKRLSQYVSNNEIVPSDSEDDTQKTNGIESHSETEDEDEDDSDDSDQGGDINDEESLEEDDIKEDLEDEEDDRDADSEDSIDYFQDIPSDDENDNENDDDKKFGPMYDDFFEDPKVIEEKEKDGTVKKRVKFDLDDDENIESDETHERKENLDVKSSFEKRQERLSQRIEKLETEALAEKPWHMIGEVTAKKRPQNSLLEQNLEFDLTVRPAPIITEEVALKLEDIIMQRIKDKAWDDVERKIKPIDAPNEFKKKLVLNQEKSKLSLAQIYEQEFLKRKEAADPEKNKEEEEPKEHKLIRAALDSLFKKLDALSNYHYTPRPAAPEVRIVNNLPAVTMEEAIPVTVSDAALVAPQEIIGKKKGNLIGKEERTSTDKKRARRHKKLMQRQKYKNIETKEKMMEKLKPGMAKKEKLKREIEKLSKDKSISHFQQEPDAKRNSKSSKQFFEKLQDTVSSKDKVKKRKKDTSQLDAKKIKL